MREFTKNIVNHQFETLYEGEELLTYLQENQTLTVDKLADLTGINYYHFTTLLKSALIEKVYKKAIEDAAAYLGYPLPIWKNPRP